MFDQDPIVGADKRKCIVVGRAAAGIYLILKAERATGVEVLVPANVCYAAIFPILYAGGKPLFCDVDALSGNVTLETFTQVCTPQTRAAIVPHMYGNPVKDMAQIAEFCRQRQILLIEDCASAMGARADYPLGQMGDYTIYSMGYSKTLDLGGGGLVCSTHNLEHLENMERELPLLSKEAADNMNFFSKMYRTIRNLGSGTALEKAIYRVLPDSLKDGFLFRVTNSEKERLFDGLAGLSNSIVQRKAVLQNYEEKLTKCQFRRYAYAEGAVPWRMCLYVEPELRKCLIAKMLDCGLPVSDWYPCVAPIFGDEGVYLGAQWHERHIVNFPIPEKTDVVEQICNVLTEISQHAEERG